MTKYSKETALYDTGAIATDITDAGTKATNYITYIDEENGIRVYDGNNETIGSPASYAQLNAGGMDIVTDEINVAHFGNDVRIGLSDGAKTVITADGLSISSSEAVAIEVSSSTGTKQIRTSESISTNWTWTSAQKSYSKTVSALSNAVANTDVVLQYVEKTGSAGQGRTHTFIKNGTSQSFTASTVTNLFTITYDGNKKFTVSKASGETGVKIQLLSVYFYIITNVPKIDMSGVTVSDGSWYLKTYKQLWENQNPTSNFAAQTILSSDADLPYCDEVRIYYRHSTTDDRVYCATGDVGTKVPLTVQGMEYNRTGGRIATVNSSGIAFGAASYNTNSNNAYAIPIKVVGVKHA